MDATTTYLSEVAERLADLSADDRYEAMKKIDTTDLMLMRRDALKCPGLRKCSGCICCEYRKRLDAEYPGGYWML